MPSGKVHALTTTLVAGSLGPILYLASGQTLEHTAAFTLGCLTGLVLTPDLDIDRGSRSHAIVRQSYGRLAAAVWIWWWYPYARLIPHRSRLSHLPLVGTVLRLLYLAIPLALVWWLVYISFPTWVTLPNPTPSWFWAFAGLAVVDTVHFLMDHL